jgi:EAL domain-containing protein (putative c-di-GMP-specific phosphodiesterase class I)
LDPHWVQKNVISATGQKWIRATVQLAKSLDACVIATEISTPTQAKILTEMGCSLGQGSLWAAPKPLQDV